MGGSLGMQAVLVPEERAPHTLAPVSHGALALDGAAGGRTTSFGKSAIPVGTSMRTGRTAADELADGFDVGAAGQRTRASRARRSSSTASGTQIGAGDGALAARAALIPYT